MMRAVVLALSLLAAGGLLRAQAPPVSVRVLTSQAAAEMQSRRPDRALALLSEALRIAPNSERLLVAYAQAALASRNPAQAVQSLEAACRLDPGNADPAYLLGVAWMQTGDMDNAAEALTRSIDLEPQRTIAYVARALSLNAKKKYAEARKDARIALSRQPDDAEANAALAEAEAGEDNLQMAEALARRVIKVAPDHLNANLTLGVVLLQMNRPQEALHALQVAERQDASSPKVQYQLSRAYSLLDRPAEAQRHVALYQQALKDMEARLKRARGIID